jgi:hypothetical protein
MRAADDFAAIRARMEELQRERELAAIRRDPDDFIRRVRIIRMEEIQKLVQGAIRGRRGEAILKIEAEPTY